MITGVGLLPGIRVAFGSTIVAAFFSPHADRIHVTTPNHLPGSVDLLVTNVDGQTAVAMGAYTFAAPDSFDVNGNWRGISFAGDYDEPFTSVPFPSRPTIPAWVSFTQGWPNRNDAQRAPLSWGQIVDVCPRVCPKLVGS